MDSISTNRKGQENILHQKKLWTKTEPQGMSQETSTANAYIAQGEEKKEEPGRPDWAQTMKDFQYQS